MELAEGVARQLGQPKLPAPRMDCGRPKRPAPVGPEPSKRQQAAREQQQTGKLEDTFDKTEEADSSSNKRDKIRLVKLRQNEKDSKLGFSLRGGQQQPLLLTTSRLRLLPAIAFGKEAATGCSVGVFVCHVERHSEAHRKGLKIGDQLIEVNGLRVSQASYEQVIGLIKQTAREENIRLVVAQAGRIPFQERNGQPIRWLEVSAADMESLSSSYSEEDELLEKELLLEEQVDEGMVSYESKSSSSSLDTGSGRENHKSLSELAASADSALSSRLSSTSSSSCSISISSLQSSSTTSGHLQQQLDLIEVKVAGGRQTAEPFGCGVVKGPQEWPGIFVQTVRAGGLAERSQLEPGDQLVEADGHHLDKMAFEEAIKLIKSLQQEQDELVLLVRKGAALRHLAAGLCCPTPTSSTAKGVPEAESLQRAGEQPMASQWSGKHWATKKKDLNPISSDADGTQSQLSGTTLAEPFVEARPEEPQVVAVTTSGLRQKWSGQGTFFGAGEPNQRQRAPSGVAAQVSANVTLTPTLCEQLERKSGVVCQREVSSTKKRNPANSNTKRLLLERLDEEEIGAILVHQARNGQQRQMAPTKLVAPSKRADELEESEREDHEEEEDEEKEEIRIVSQNCKLHHYQSSQFHSKSHLELLEHKFPHQTSLLAVTTATQQQLQQQQQRRPLAPRQRPPVQHQLHRYLSTDNLSQVSQQQLMQLHRAHRSSVVSNTSRGRPQHRLALADCCLLPSGAQANGYRRSNSVLGQPILPTNQCCQPHNVPSRSCCLSRPPPRRLHSTSAANRCHLLVPQHQHQQRMVRARSVDRLNMSISLNYLNITSQHQYNSHHQPRAIHAAPSDCCSLQDTAGVCANKANQQVRRIEPCCCPEPIVATTCCQATGKLVTSSPGCYCRRLGPQTSLRAAPVGPAAYCAACCQPPIVSRTQSKSRLAGTTTDSSSHLSARGCERRPRHQQAPPPKVVAAPQPPLAGSVGNRQRGAQLSTFGHHNFTTTANQPTSCCRTDSEPAIRAPVTSSISTSASSPSSASSSSYSLAPSPESRHSDPGRATPPALARANPPPCPPPPPAPDAELENRIGSALRQYRKEQQAKQLEKVASNGVRERLCFVDELKMLAKTSAPVAGETQVNGGSHNQDSATLIKIINASKAQAKQQQQQQQRCSCQPAHLPQHLCAKSNHLAGQRHDITKQQGKSVKTTSKLDDEDSKRRQHEMLMKEFKSAHSKMFKRRNNSGNLEQEAGAKLEEDQPPEEVRLIKTSLMGSNKATNGKQLQSGFRDSGGNLQLAAAAN